MDLKNHSQPCKLKENTGTECRYSFIPTTGQVLKKHINPYDTVGDSPRKSIRDNPSVWDRSKLIDIFDNRLKTPNTETTYASHHELRQENNFSENGFINQRYTHQDKNSVYHQSNENILHNISLDTPYPTPCSTSISRKASHVQENGTNLDINNQRPLSNYAIVPESQNSERNHESQPQDNVNNDKCIFKLIQRNARIQLIMKELFEERQKEKQRQAWHNYISKLRNKHGMYSNQPFHQYEPHNFIEDCTTKSEQYNEQCQKLLSEFYKSKRQMQQTNNLVENVNEYYMPAPEPKKYVESNRFCFPISSQGRLSMLNKEKGIKCSPSRSSRRSQENRATDQRNPATTTRKTRQILVKCCENDDQQEYNMDVSSSSGTKTQSFRSISTVKENKQETVNDEFESVTSNVEQLKNNTIADSNLESIHQKLDNLTNTIYCFIIELRTQRQEDMQNAKSQYPDHNCRGCPQGIDPAASIRENHQDNNQDEINCECSQGTDQIASKCGCSDKNIFKWGFFKENGQVRFKCGCSQRKDQDNVKRGFPKENEQEKIICGCSQEKDKVGSKCGFSQRNDEDNVKCGCTKKNDQEIIQGNDHDKVKLECSQGNDQDIIECGCTQEMDSLASKRGYDKKNDQEKTKCGCLKRNDQDLIKSKFSQVNDQDKIKCECTQEIIPVASKRGYDQKKIESSQGKEQEKTTCECSKGNDQKVSTRSCIGGDNQERTKCECFQRNNQNIIKCKTCSQETKLDRTNCECYQGNYEDKIICGCSQGNDKNRTKCECLQGNAKFECKCGCSQRNDQARSNCECSQGNAQNIVQCECSQGKTQVSAQCGCSQGNAQVGIECECTNKNAQFERNCKCTQENAQISSILPNSIRISASVRSTSSLRQIIREEERKSNKIKRDIDQLLDMCSGSCSVEVEIPTKDDESMTCCDTCSGTCSKKPSRVENVYYTANVNQRAGMTMAANTDPLGLLALVKLSTDAVKQFLSFMNLNDLYFPRILPPRPCDQFVCNICGTKFNHSTQLSEHIRQHIPVRTRTGCTCQRVLDQCQQSPVFKCSHCGEIFTRAYSRELHRLTCAKMSHWERESLVYLK